MKLFGTVCYYFFTKIVQAARRGRQYQFAAQKKRVSSRYLVWTGPSYPKIGKKERGNNYRKEKKRKKRR